LSDEAAAFKAARRRRLRGEKLCQEFLDTFRGLLAQIDSLRRDARAVLPQNTPRERLPLALQELTPIERRARRVVFRMSDAWEKTTRRYAVGVE